MATISINTPQQYITLISGGYPSGTSEEHLIANITADLDFGQIADLSSVFNAGYSYNNPNQYTELNGNGHTLKNIIIYNVDDYFGFAVFFSINNVKFENCRIQYDARYSSTFVYCFSDIYKFVWGASCQIITTDSTSSLVYCGGKMLESCVCGLINIADSDWRLVEANVVERCFTAANITTTGALRIFNTGNLFDCFSRNVISGVTTYRFVNGTNLCFNYNADTFTSTPTTCIGIWGSDVNGIFESWYDSTNVPDTTGLTCYAMSTADLKNSSVLLQHGWAIGV